MSSSNLATETTSLLSNNQPKDVSSDKPKISAWKTLPAIWVGSFLSALDMTVVASLYPVIGSEFDSLNYSSFIATSYLITNTAFQPLYGRLSDIFGRRTMLLFANTVFMLGTVWCGFARSLGELCLARAFAGIGGGGLTTLSSICGSDIVSLRERGTWQGFANIVFGIGGSLGGPFGGFVNARWGWRSAFLLQVPLCLGSIALVSWRVRLPTKDDGVSSKQKLARIDYLGSFLLVSAVTTMVTLFTFGGDRFAWMSPVSLALTALFGFLTVMFYIVERDYAREPIAPMKVLRERTPLCAYIGNFTNALCSFAVMYEVPLFFEAVLFQNSEEAGARMFPMVLSIPVGSLSAGLYMKRTGTYRGAVIFGFTAMLCTLFTFMFLFRRGQGVSLKYIGVALGMAGLSYGTSLTSTLISIISALPIEYQAISTGVSYLFRATGSVVGISMGQTALQATLTSSLHRSLEDIPDKESLIDAIRRSVTVVPTLPKHIQKIVVHSYVQAFIASFALIAVFGLIGFLSSLFIRQHVLYSTVDRR
ncbi:vacuolar membrane amino acid uptake transporter Fnx1 [Schizosaccharomyces japonicus yFS275]|uniref:Vacuolar membrane amino acid uptake transporter Fnx1 n=1 Tax=Schizosaccharomyces japonicus (strain yFS275 / FY16936) TaxID=402676 RepID=B6K7L1_SCHJY|nr:vacuolar membrane amino acid uptake transporter Fnx1 [Schizosaccharomyces japonicus yFS275]EEB09515.1 vacuolar membrane amino acid uptake transporter Fnx1 [Schizosaccharomyces japonicus yFS275]